MRRKATQLVKAVGWLERRNVQIKHINAERSRPMLGIMFPCPDLLRRAKEIIETHNGRMRQGGSTLT